MLIVAYRLSVTVIKRVCMCRIMRIVGGNVGIFGKCSLVQFKVHVHILYERFCDSHVFASIVCCT